MRKFLLTLALILTILGYSYDRPILDSNMELSSTFPIRTSIFALSDLKGVPTDLSLNIFLDTVADIPAVAVVSCNEQFLGTLLLNKKDHHFFIPTQLLYNEGNVLKITLGTTRANGKKGLPENFRVILSSSSNVSWTKYSLPLRNITQFLMIASGRIALYADHPDSTMVKTLVELWNQINPLTKNLDVLPISNYSQNNWNNYDYIMIISNNSNVYKDFPINIDEGNFEFINPLNGRILFDSKTAGKPYWLWQLTRNKIKPLLAIYSSNPEADFPVEKTTIHNLERQAASVAVTVIGLETTSYETNKQLIVNYQKSLSFEKVWYKYRLYFIAFFTVLSLMIIYQIGIKLKGVKGNV